MSALIEKARAFAIEAHEAIQQRRKYSGAPYWVHPQAVAEMVAGVCEDEAVIAAAWLHDTVEDTPKTLTEIRSAFGDRVSALVDDLTDPSRPNQGNRQQRKAIDRAHTALAHPDAKTVKLADLIHNTESIAQVDPGFARIYLREKLLLLEVLKEGDPALYQRAQRQLKAALQSLEGPHTAQKKPGKKPGSSA